MVASVMLPFWSGSSFLLGTLLYWAYFHRYETHLYGVTFLGIFVSLYIGSAAALSKITAETPIAALSLTTQTALAFLFGVYGNTLAFRLLLHPLNRFPGPFAARISSLWLSTQLSKSDGYLVLERLHKRYGQYVRIGSNDLSIIDPEFLALMHSKESRITKAAWYDNDHPLHSMHTTRDSQLHARRRRVWAPAFSDKALREYEPMIRKFADQLVLQFSKHATDGDIINVTKWFNLFAFDAMGMLAFGKEYNMVQQGKKPTEIALLSDGMEPFALRLPPWLFRMLAVVPGLAASYNKFVVFCVNELTWRVKIAREADGDSPDVGKDVMSWLLRAYKDMPHPELDPLLQADAKLTIVAGSDTTAAALTFLFFHLAKHPEIASRLREELEPLCGAGGQGVWSDSDLRTAPLLNACINETLRLYPPVPSGLYRLTPPEGMQVGRVHIPGNVTFVAPLYSIGQNHNIYVQPDRFWPERWTTQQDKVLHPEAFTPFSAGPMGCIGKNVALMELRVVTAALLSKFDLTFAPGEDGHRLLQETKDHFTLALGDLDLKVEALQS